MKLFLAGVFVLVAATGFAQTVPEIAFDSVPNFLKLPPDVNLGEAAGVAVNAEGAVFVFSRSSPAVGPAYGSIAAQLFEFAPDGTFRREIGKNIHAWAYAHGVRVDRNNNIWAVDKGSDYVIRFNPQGHVTLVLGR